MPRDGRAAAPPIRDLLLRWNATHQPGRRPDRGGRASSATSPTACNCCRCCRPTGPIADLGSGGGLPGLVLAAALPDREVHLVESDRRKAAFLIEAAGTLGLAQVKVHPQRIEQAAPAAASPP